MFCYLVISIKIAIEILIIRLIALIKKLRTLVKIVFQVIMFYFLNFQKETWNSQPTKYTVTLFNIKPGKDDNYPNFIMHKKLNLCQLLIVLYIIENVRFYMYITNLMLYQ